AKTAVIRFLEEKGIGAAKVNYKLRDWVFSRQRYWGEPIPIIHCEGCGAVPVPESELPVILPKIDSYEPTDTGESPLAKISDWVNTVCPVCGGAAKRETDTMPQWAGSSWYFLRYADPRNDACLASREALEYWTPVNWYNGGMEHTTLHVLYSRFWHKFLYDIGVVPTPEPYARRTSHGMILGENGEKMSKSRGNVVNPDDIVNEYGADTMRLYEMFVGDFEKAAPWSSQSIKGCKRFLERVWNLQAQLTPGDSFSPALERDFHRVIKKVTLDIEDLKFNTAIAAMMGLFNRISDMGTCSRADYRTLLLILNPFAPHMTEELWEICDFGGQLNAAAWPAYNEALCARLEVELAVSVNGKVKARITVPVGADDEEVLEKARASVDLAGKTPVKEIVVKDKLVNLVVRG
ncbi:MAG: class I tRNA ligase family protein, partial [Oscillospiraceae bacterium]|nr:class I tRNA ligase family protein [Oscillospiraceae bacterium]